MRRQHFNMTNEPMKFRTWLLAVESIDEADFLWLKAFDIPIRIEAPNHSFTTMNGGTHTIQGKPSYTCDTTTDKQRNMLVLKYGPSAVLIQEEHLLPGSMSACTLSEIRW